MTEDRTTSSCVLIVDDNDFNRAGLGLYLSSRGYVPVEAGDEATAIAVAEEHQPGSAIVDIVIPVTAGGRAHINQSVGLSLVRRLKTLDPTMGIVVFSAYEDRGGEVWDLIRDGVRGIAYLLKGSRPERLLEALEATRAGQVILDSDAALGKRQLASEIRAHLTSAERPWVEEAVRLIPTLSARELDVARRLAASHNTQGLAQALGMAPKTAENHIGHLYDKLGLSGVDTSAPELRKSALLAKACMIYELTQADEAGRMLSGGT